MAIESWCAYRNQDGDVVTLRKVDFHYMTERIMNGTGYASDRDDVSAFEKGSGHEFGDSEEEALAAFRKTEERLEAGEIVTSSLWW